MLAARVKQVQAAMPVVQLIITPMMFLSGALFPLSNLPRWLDLATKLNPMTYAVEPMRSAAFDRLHMADGGRSALDPGIAGGGWQVPVGAQLPIVVVLSVAMLSLAVARFARTE